MQFQIQDDDVQCSFLWVCYPVCWRLCWCTKMSSTFSFGHGRISSTIHYGTVWTHRITSSSSFRKNYKSLATSVEINRSYGGFSGSAKAAYDEVTDSVEANSEEREEVNTNWKTYNPDFLQIQRKITTVVSIDGKVAKMIDKEIGDSVPSENSLTKGTETPTRKGIH